MDAFDPAAPPATTPITSFVQFPTMVFQNQAMTPLPGVFTPTEAFSAIRAGAKHLKLFPAEAASPTTIKAWKAVLPKEIKIHAVGGITPSNMKDWVSAGVTGFGVGSNLYKPGKSISDIAKDARTFAEAYAKARS